MVAPSYIGRFAPTPSGPLHFGSLVAALASYLDAHHHRGHWLVRIDNIDPPREAPGAADTILKQLAAHGLHWHGSVRYQGQRNDAYQAAIEQLQQAQVLYRCDCSRQQLRAMGGIYNGHCRQRQLPDAQQAARRINTDRRPAIQWQDFWQGSQCWDLAGLGGDFIVQRRDGLYAYQLACAVDDLDQKISHVVRGSDLLDSTPRQLLLMNELQPDHPTPQYGHIPVAVAMNGQKLSKQNLAAAIDGGSAAANLTLALQWLGHPPPSELLNAPCELQLQWAVAHWQRAKIGNEVTKPAPKAL